MRCFTLSIALLLAGSLCADEVFVKNKEKPLKGTVQKESAKGVQLAGKEFIPAEDILDIHYDLKTENKAVLDSYQLAYAKDRESQEKTTGRRPNMEAAMFEYDAAATKLEAGQEFAKRNMEFRIAVLRARVSTEFRATLTPAIKKLTDFKAKHPDSWQLSQCLQTLAGLNIDQRDFIQADKCYQELSVAPVSDELKQEAEFLQVQMSLRQGNPQQAQTRLKALASKLPKDSKNAIRAVVGQAECLALMKKGPEAIKIFQQMIKDAADPGVKAMAYNGLGKSYFDQGMLKEARWEFLWVDIVFNSDKAEHAKAIYYLWKISSELKETEHAQEYRDFLLSDRQFTGLEFQRRIQSEAK